MIGDAPAMSGNIKKKIKNLFNLNLKLTSFEPEVQELHPPQAITFWLRGDATLDEIKVAINLKVAGANVSLTISVIEGDSVYDASRRPQS